MRIFLPYFVDNFLQTNLISSKNLKIQEFKNLKIQPSHISHLISQIPFWPHGNFLSFGEPAVSMYSGLTFFVWKQPSL